ncbi:threonine ammonia-lyase, biosynthetic [Alginatibacterium sediminis]|uniref:L-threonine dehydratase n=1 Tax=Alginatibacterium sediminis TaxID=2164068 RepID=A0A420ELD9_9ALTE|nr:threonine ammonia-lyase, biosynthetic [Alginatibacterium sediminis]RKF21527.1 threonine ammonia-lyase, biosynthetic [Alginatibacterium sediminis]
MPANTPSANEYLRRILLSPVYEVARVTPLQQMKKLEQRLGQQVLLKREDLQPVHSFKLRGAYNCLAQLSDNQKQAGVIAASAGNHAQGVAMSAQKMGIKAVIVMPTTTPEIKVSSVRAWGAQVRLFGDNFDEASQHSQQLATQYGYTRIPPFDDINVIAGQGTIGKELLEQDMHLDAVFVPVGGGGIAAGISVYLKQLMPHVKVIAVESEDSACLKAALAAGEPVDLDRVGLFADGVAVKRIGTETFRLCQQYVDEVITVNSDEICAAIKDIFEDTRAIAEPSGALALAGLKQWSKQQAPNQRLAAILSGANLNFHNLRYVSERTEIGERKEAILAVTIPERSGAYLDFVRHLGGRAITEFNYRYADADRASIFVGIRVSDADQELPGLIQNLESDGYEVVDLSGDELAKQHVRYMVGGRPNLELKEHLFSFEFPEQPGALLKFLSTLGSQWNITLFHYRNHGAAYGRVLAGFELSQDSLGVFQQYLEQLGFDYSDETQNPAYRFFLR